MKVDNVDPNEKTEEIRKENKEAIHKALHDIENEKKEEIKPKTTVTPAQGNKSSPA